MYAYTYFLVSVAGKAIYSGKMCIRDSPYSLKRRILSPCGHLSNDACGSFLCELAAHGLRGAMLAHLSEENNHPALARATVMHALSQAGVPLEEVFLAVAEQNAPVFLVQDGHPAENREINIGNAVPRHA